MDILIGDEFGQDRDVRAGWLMNYQMAFNIRVCCGMMIINVDFHILFIKKISKFANAVSLAGIDQHQSFYP